MGIWAIFAVSQGNSLSFPKPELGKGWGEGSSMKGSFIPCARAQMEINTIHLTGHREFILYTEFHFYLDEGNLGVWKRSNPCTVNREPGTRKEMLLLGSLDLSRKQLESLPP